MTKKPLSENILDVTIFLAVIILLFIVAFGDKIVEYYNPKTQETIESECTTLPPGYKIIYNTVNKKYAYCSPCGCIGINIDQHDTKEKAIKSACEMKKFKEQYRDPIDKEELKKDKWIDVK